MKFILSVMLALCLGVFVEHDFGIVNLSRHVVTTQLQENECICEQCQCCPACMKQGKCRCVNCKCCDNCPGRK